MVFNEKLTLLIELFNENSSKLARAINVDPSLVSKWRCGARTISLSSNHAKQIAEYFICKDSLQYQKEALLNILKLHKPNINENNPQELKSALVEWLFTKSSTLVKTTRQNYLFNLNRQTENINTGLDLLKENNISLDTNALILPEINTAKGEPGNSEIFRGNEGKRKAVLNIFNIMLASKDSLQFTYYDETSIEWLIEDDEFFTVFKKITRHLIGLGHKICIINYLNRDIFQNMKISSFWIPFQSSRNTEFYYLPKYYKPLFNKTLCLVKSAIVMFSIDMNTASQPQTILCTNPMIELVAEEIFNASLKNCIPLYVKYGYDNMRDLLKEIIKMEETPQNHYTMSGNLSAITMPILLYSKMLDTLPLSPVEKKELLGIHTNRVKTFKSYLNCYKYIELIDSKILKIYSEYDSNHIFKYGGPEYLTCNTLECNFTDFSNHLSNIVHLLKEYENYEAILVDLKEIQKNNISLHVCEKSTAIIISQAVDSNNPYASITHEYNTVESIKYLIIESIEMVPLKMRSKEYTIQELERIIIRISSCRGDH